MVGEFLLAFFMFRYLRRSLKDSDLLHRWDKIFLGGMIASIALIVAETVVQPLQPFTPWVAYLFLLYIVYLIYRVEEFKQGRPYLIAIFPFIAASMLSRIVETINPDFYKTCGTLFGGGQCIFFYMDDRHGHPYQQAKESTGKGKGKNT